MSVEKYIKDNVGSLADRVYVAPNIPDKKMNAAISSMAQDIEPEYVLAIVDTTLLGGAKNGALFTGEYLFLRAIASQAVKIQLSTIKRAEYTYEEIEKDNGKVEKKEKVTIIFKDGNTKDVSGDIVGMSYSKFADLINGIVAEASDDGEFVSTSQTRPLSMMDVGIKKAYMKLICNFAFSDDGIIDSEEYADIISLIVRIEMDAQTRLYIRSYMIDPDNKESNDSLLKYLEETVDAGSFDIVKQSLMKDVLYIYRKKKGSGWKQNSFISDLQEKLQLSDKQVEYIDEAIKKDEDILAERKNDSEIVKSMKDLASKATGVGVPLAAIYFSGSVTGISAAGLTSGLAALGMGGFLGFSSMFTGIGVAVLLGIGTYKGVKKITGLSDLENNKQREMMLQAIIKNSQKSLNYLIEDVNEITKQLKAEIEKGLESEAKIKKLAVMLGKLTKGAQMTSDKIQHAQKEKVIAKLPMKLDVIRVQELTAEATKKKIGELIKRAYIPMESTEEDGTVRKYFVLNDKLPCNELEEVYDALDGIGYFKVADAAMASVKGAAKSWVKNLMG